MYIRRKVFSLLNVNGEDRYFSTTEYSINENGECRLFAEKEEKKEKKGLSTGAKVGIGAAGVAGAAGGAVYGAHKIGSKVLNKALEEGNRIMNAETKGQLSEQSLETVKKSNAKKVKVGENLQKPGEAVKKAADKTKEVSQKAGKKTVEVAKSAGKKVGKVAKKVVRK